MKAMMPIKNPIDAKIPERGAIPYVFECHSADLKK